jgi:hypothetical protein
MDSSNVRIRIKIDDEISKKGNHILGHKQPFQQWCSSSFGWLGVIPSRSISPCHLRYVSKSFKQTPKNMRCSDFPEDFEVRGMEEAQLSPNQPQLCPACAWSQAQNVFSFDHCLMERWKQPDRQLKGGFPPLSFTRSDWERVYQLKALHYLWHHHQRARSTQHCSHRTTLHQSPDRGKGPE